MRGPFGRGDAAAPVDRFENYSMDIPVKRITGAVIEKSSRLTPAQLATVADAPAGVDVARQDFKVGNKAYTRVAFAGSDPAIAAALKKLADILGPNVQIDWCIEKEPGPPFGMEPASFSALNSELPQATVRLRPPVRTAGAR